MQPPLVVGEDQEVIDVADVAQPESVGDEVVERVEVDVGEELAGLVAERQAPAPFGGSEQVVAGKPHQHRVLGVAVVDDPVHQPEDIGVFDLAGDQVLEDGVVDRREELADIRLQDVAVTAGELLAAVHGGVGALALAAGVAVVDERPLEDRLQHAGQGVMHDPVPERGGADLAGLPLVDREGAVGTGAIGLGGEFVVEPEAVPARGGRRSGRRRA